MSPRRSRDFAKLAFDSGDAAMGVDRRQRIVFWNQAARELFGLKAEDVLGRRCDQVMRGRDESRRFACRATCPLLSRTLDGGPIRAMELFVKTRSGRALWVAVSTLRLRSTRRGLTLVHLFRDIDRQKRTDQCLQQLVAAVSGAVATERLDAPDSSRTTEYGLTRREREVLRLLVGGVSTRRISERLCISVATARNHVHHILVKLKAHSRLEAVCLALRSGVL
jgi:PAS domain S-box-containing protein